MMAGGIFERYNWPEGRSDYVEVCDGCHTAIWSTRWNEETSDASTRFSPKTAGATTSTSSIPGF